MSKFQWLDDERLIQDKVFEGVPSQVRDVFDEISEFDCGLSLLRFLDAHANKLMSSDDIAYHLSQPQAEVERCLDAMVKLDVARRRELADHVFFGLTVDRERQRLVSDLLALQDIWRARLARIELVIDGKALHRRSHKRP